MRPAADDFGDDIAGKIAEHNMDDGPENRAGYIPKKKSLLLHLSRAGDKRDEGACRSDKAAPENTFCAIFSKKFLALRHIFRLDDFFSFKPFSAPAAQRVAGIVTDNRAQSRKNYDVSDLKIALSGEETGKVD